MASNGEMTGAVLPGNSTVELRRYPVPSPGHGQVLLRMKASSLCGSDIRAIYREHLGVGAEKYQGRDRRPRALRPGRGHRPGMPALCRRRPGDRLPHLRLRLLP